MSAQVAGPILNVPLHYRLVRYDIVHSSGKAMIRPLFITCAFILATTSASADCGSDSSARLKAFARLLNRHLPQEGLWPGFDFRRVNFIVFDSSSSKTCALIRSNENIFLGTSASEINQGGFCYASSTSSKCPSGVRFPEDAVIWDLHNKSVGLSDQLRIENLQYQYQQLAHESFHLYGQTNGQLHPNGKRWPNQYGALPFEARAEIKSKCYALNSRVALLQNKEMHESFLMLHAVLRHRPTSAVLLHTRLFEKLRNLRWAALAETQVMTPDGALSCQVAEDQLEMLEGTAEYVGLKVANLTEAISSEKNESFIYRSYHFVNVPGDYGAYYTNGIIQFFVIDALENGLGHFVDRLNSDNKLLLQSEMQAIANGN